MGVFEINDLQKRIMIVICDWSRQKKTPAPKNEIISIMLGTGVKTFTTDSALTSLLRKRYIRRAYTRDHRTFYVALRSV